MAELAMTVNRPLVSICVANYDGMTVIDDCLQSVLAQEGGIALEIIVHDDASRDGSVGYIRDRYPAAQLIESKSNVGFCEANNRMAAQAQGEYLLLLNNDAALYPDALKTLLAEASRLVQPAILGLPQFDATSGELVDMGSFFDPFLNPIPNRDSSLNDVGMVIGACLWIPRHMWEELGGFPEWFESLAEDMYLCCRARLAGYPVRALPTSGYRHWQGKSFGGNRVSNKGLATTFRRRALSERNKSFVMVLTYPVGWMWPMLALHLSLLFVEACLLTLVKMDWRFWREIYAPCFLVLWEQRRFLLKLRHEIQDARRVDAAVVASVFRLVPYKLLMLARHGLPRLS
jgi:GT2 family glycosyltransferase